MADYKKKEGVVGKIGLSKNDAFFTLDQETQKTTPNPVYKGWMSLFPDHIAELEGIIQKHREEIAAGGSKDKDKPLFLDVAYWLEKDAGKIAKGQFLSGSVSEQWQPENKQEPTADSSPNDDIPF